jgi:hypothetical protein
MGWFSLIDHLRISPYRRHQDVPKGAVDGKGLAGAFEDFLGKHPNVVKVLDRAILAREPGKPPGTKRHSRQVFRAFLRACRVPDERLSDADYPLNTKSKGRRSVYRYIERYLQRNPTKIGPWYGEDAAKRVKLGNGRRSFVFASRPFDESCADAHRIDCIGTLEVNGPAGQQRVPVQRLWLYLYVDTVSRAILALALAATHAESRGLHDVASRLSRCGVHALFRALPTILDGSERIAWELTGATSTRWNTTYSYVYKRGLLSVARYRELCARLSAELSSLEKSARDRWFVS